MEDASAPVGGHRARAEALRASPPLFRSRALDRLTRVHPAVPPVIFVPAIVVLAVFGARDIGWTADVVAIVGGYVVWSLCEYWGHRAVVHCVPENGLGA